MVAKTKRGEATRRRVLLIASDLFHKQGVRATSPDEIIAASGIGKGQFYYYFKGKQDLVHQVLQAHLKAIERDETPIHHRIETWDELERWFSSHLDLQAHHGMSRGCPYGVIANELGADDELLRLDLSLIFEIIRHHIVRFLVAEAARGHLSEGADPESLADFSMAAVQGAMVLGKVKRDPALVERVFRESMAHLKHQVRGDI